MALNVGAAQEGASISLVHSLVNNPKVELEYIASSSSLHKHRKGYKLKDGIQGKHLDGSLAKNDLQPEQKSILRERSILISLAVIKKEVVALCNM
jgi:hypothetical protein